MKRWLFPTILAFLCVAAAQIRKVATPPPAEAEPSLLRKVNRDPGPTDSTATTSPPSPIPVAAKCASNDANCQLPAHDSPFAAPADAAPEPRVGLNAEFERIGREAKTDKMLHHGYHRFYPDEIQMYRSLKFGMIEIGIQYGPSLKLWKEVQKKYLAKHSRAA
jgi:hypothetical protein